MQWRLGTSWEKKGGEGGDCACEKGEEKRKKKKRKNEFGPRIWAYYINKVDLDTI